jgi:membrane protein DedA with SNARE-associated domain
MFGPFLSFLKGLSVFAYPLLFAGSCFEVLMLVAIFVPGELFFYAGGILSAAGFLSIWATLAACIAGGYVGDICSFYIGKRYAARMERALESWRIFHDAYDSGREFMTEHGDSAVFLARFLGPAAWVTPFLPGLPACPSNDSSCSISFRLCAPFRFMSASVTGSGSASRFCGVSAAVAPF